MKKIIVCFLFFLMILPRPDAISDGGADIASMIQNAAAYVSDMAPSPAPGAIGGEWAVLGVLRSGAQAPANYFESYKKSLAETLRSSNGVLHQKKYTEYSRAVIALSALGEDPRSFAGFDIVSPLTDFEKTVWQGINGPVWALIALDCCGYGGDEIRLSYIGHILSLEKEGGGWSLSSSSTEGDVDVTAMVITSLAPYRDRSEVRGAVERGLTLLSDAQNERGGYSSFGVENSESAAQVLTAMSSLAIPYTDERFVKNTNTIPDYLKTYLRSEGGFAHEAGDKSANLMATEQCLYSLAAAERLLKGQTSLFDMSDVLKSEKPSSEVDSGAKDVIKYPNKTFEDIKDLPEREAIEGLAERGIVNGISETSFAPEATMTRAQYATITVNALALPSAAVKAFDDVNEEDWFYPYVGTAYSYKLVNGVSESRFSPSGTITREQAAVMLRRAAALCGLDTDMSGYSLRDILSEFSDYTTVSDWAADAVAFCYKEAILDPDVLEIKPQEAVTRKEIAKTLFVLLKKADLI